MVEVEWFWRVVRSNLTRILVALTPSMAYMFGERTGIVRLYASELIAALGIQIIAIQSTMAIVVGTISISRALSSMTIVVAVVRTDGLDHLS